MTTLKFYESLKAIFYEVEVFVNSTLDGVQLTRQATIEKESILRKLRELQNEYPQLRTAASLPDTPKSPLNKEPAEKPNVKGPSVTSLVKEEEEEEQEDREIYADVEPVAPDSARSSHLTTTPSAASVSSSKKSTAASVSGESEVADSITSFIGNGFTSSKEIYSDDPKPVMGLGVVNNELFVVRDSQSKVNVFDSHSLTSSCDIKIPDLKSPQGLAGCAHNKALYISDSGLKCIHRLNLTNNSVTRRTMKKVYVPRGLSVAAEHNLLVTVLIGDTPGESGVVEYTNEGQQVREIRLDRSIKHAWQTVQLSSNQFIICQGALSSLHRVHQINAEGQIIKSYGRERGGAEVQLYGPHSLTIDNNSKHIFIADMDNHVILLFDSDLTYLGQVHTPRDLRSPTRLYFDSSTDRLFVGEGSKGRVIVISPTV